MRFRRSLLSLALLFVAVDGCRMFRPIDPSGTRPSSEAATPDTAMATTAAPTPPPVVVPESNVRARDPGTVNDRTIAAMVLALNNTDISYARLVPTRSQRDDVRRYAQRMLTDHAGLNALVNELLIRTGMTAEDNNASVDLRDESAERRDAMRGLTGFAFDSAYMSNEISFHRRFLESIDQVMMPRARNEEVKGLLVTLRPAVAAHLAHAEQLWTTVMTKK